MIHVIYDRPPENAHTFTDKSLASPMPAPQFGRPNRVHTVGWGYVVRAYLKRYRTGLCDVGGTPVQSQHTALGGIPGEQHVLAALEQILGGVAAVAGRQRLAQPAKHLVPAEPEAVGFHFGHCRVAAGCVREVCGVRGVGVWTSSLLKAG